MKKVLTLTSVILISLCLLLLASCAKSIDKVSNFKLDSDTLTLSWDRVLGARTYTVSVSGENFERSSKSNSVSLEYLEPGTYEIKVKAVGDGIEKKDSDWASYTFVRETESGMRYKLINNKTAYELTGLGTASGDVVMDDTYRGKPVVSIADKAFAGNSRITSFVIGKNVTEIGDSAFARCAELTSITIPEGVTYLGKSCFQSCKKLTSVIFPDSITTIPEYMFSWCTALESVTVGKNTDTVSEYAFSNCKALKNIEFTDSLKLIDEYAFSDCESMTEAALGDKLEVIGPYAFYNCILLSDLSIGTSVKIIDEYAFGNCQAITSFAVPDSCETLGHFALRYCRNLEEVTLGESLTFVGHGVFNDTKLYNETEGALIIDGWYIYSKDKEIAAVEIPETVYGLADSAFYGCQKITMVNLQGIKYLCHYAFYGCTSLNYAMFDNALLSIGDYAFKNCTNLLNLNLGQSIQSIGNFAFAGCSKLQDQRITAFPNTLTSIGKDAFRGTKATVIDNIMYIKNWVVGTQLPPGMGFNSINIRAGTRGIANYSFNQASVLQLDLTKYGITIPDSVEYIGRGAFYKSMSAGYAVTVSLSKNLKYIGDYAFYGCYCAFFEGMNKELILPEGLEYIGRSAFYGCESIYFLSIPGTVKNISPYAFYGCTNIGANLGETEDDPGTPGYITLGEGIESISDKAFYGCINIASLTIPDSITSLGNRVFYKCSGLRELSVGAGLTEIEDYAFYGCALLEKLTLSDSITRIGNYAFRGCTALTEINFGSSVTEIGDFAFLGAENLKALSVPDSVTSIGKHAFRGMSSARQIILPSTVSTIGAHAFYGASNAVIYIDGEVAEDGWDERWNSSFAPVITNCALSEDKTFVVSFVKDGTNPDNMPVQGAIASPVKEGYSFAGFTKNPNGTEAEYTTTTLSKAPNGTTLYTVWKPNTTPTE